jgi:hypothetical protein
VKVIRFSYSNKDIKDEEEEEVSVTARIHINNAKLPAAMACRGRTPAVPTDNRLEQPDVLARQVGV